jgi:protein O-GlcNAc transferase
MPADDSPAYVAAAEHFQAQRYPEAEAACRRLLQRAPRDHRVVFMLGCTLVARGDMLGAIYQLERATQLAPGIVEYRVTLASAHRRLRQFDEAHRHARAAVDAAPHSADAWAELAACCRGQDRVTDAREALQRALPLATDHVQLGSIEFAAAELALHNADPEAALPHARRSAEYDPEPTSTWCVLGYAACAASDVSPEETAELHRQIGATFAYPGPDEPLLVTDFDPERRLRVALLSPDLVEHSVTFFLEPLIEHIDPAQIELHAYFSSAFADHVTARLKPRFAKWHDLPGGRDRDVADLLRRERIDIAIDLAGYTEGSLIWALRRRCAPIQATYLGYPHSTGLPGIDYRFVDRVTDPEGPSDEGRGASGAGDRASEGPHPAPSRLSPFASERLVDLDPCFLCYRPPASAPPARASRQASDAPITFGCFNNPAKISRRTRELWAAVLSAVPNSKLLLKGRVFAHEQGRREFLASLAPFGIDPSRLELIARLPERVNHLQLYHRVDIALDTFPYTGTTTTCEALWMGVPVLTAPGRSHASRVSTSILRAAGLPELVAPSDSPAALAELAAGLAADGPRLAALHATLRERLARSPLLDAPAFAARFTHSLRTLWRAHCGGKG